MFARMANWLSLSCTGILPRRAPLRFFAHRSSMWCFSGSGYHRLMRKSLMKFLELAKHASRAACDCQLCGRRGSPAMACVGHNEAHPDSFY